MKTKLLVAFAAFVWMGTAAFAQITVTNTNVATIGKLIRQTTDTTPVVSIIPGPPGTNQIWNFSALHTQKVDTFVFEDPTWTTYGVNFPASNIAAVLPRQNTDEYLLNTTGGLFIEGAAAELPGSGNQWLNEHMVPASKLMTWPSSYNTNYTDNYMITGKAYWTPNAGVDSVRIKNVIMSNCVVDAWGSVTTPLGTFASIRQKRHKVEADSTWARAVSGAWTLVSHSLDTLDHYDWWTNDPTIGFPLVGMDMMSHATVPSNVQWLIAAPTPQAVIELADISGFIAYPNPANDYINIRLKPEDVASIAVLDMSGRNVLGMEKVVDATTRLNTESLNNGMYFLVVTGNSGQRSVKKFSIVR
jgi:hypothetical protein